ncbi:MAG: PilZ domain-containing protein [Planctomycetota bacterium]|nr:MAG: PilZ domain-containing protein [Planctomycetota bacterium]
MSETERRRDIRVESVNLVNYSAEIQADLGGPPEAHLYSILGTARTEDLSSGGCKLITREEVPAGILLDLSLKLADHLVTCRAKVVHAHAEGEEWVAGLEFLDLDDEVRDGIKLYLEFKDDAGVAEG